MDLELRPPSDPRVLALRTAVSGLRHALAAHQAHLPDRGTAEEQLAALDGMTETGVPDPSKLRHALLLILSALGSVSALSAPLAEFRSAVGQFSDPATHC